MTKKQSSFSKDKKAQTLLNEYIDEIIPNMKWFHDIEDVAKSIMWPLINKMLEAEMTHHVWYDKYAIDWYNTGNSRNGSYTKNIRTTQWDMEVSIPRDRKWEFSPSIIEKHKKNAWSIEEKIIKMMALGMTSGDICDHLQEAYGASANKDMIRTVSDALLPEIQERKNRPLQGFYTVVYLDAIHFKVKENAKYVNKAAYVILGIWVDGIKDVLWIYLGENESSSFWQWVCTQMRNRWVEDILFACIDWLSGFSKAVTSNFPGAIVQRCIVHQIRSTTRYVTHKDRKEFIEALKKIYKAVSLEVAETALLELQEKRGKTYAPSVNSRVDNRAELSAYFAYTDNIRKLIYTTNPIESFNRQLRNVTKKIPVFPNEDSLMKRLYLWSQKATKKWTMPAQNWGRILSELVLQFEERVEKRVQ